MGDESFKTGKQSDLAARYSVRSLRAKERGMWDTLVRKSPHGKLFHTHTWLEAIGRPFHIQGCFEEGKLVGGMVLVEASPRVARYSYHFGPYLGVVLPPPLPKYLTNLRRHRDVMTVLANHAKMDFRAIYCQLVPEVVDILPFISAGYYTQVFYTYRINLTEFDQVWRNMEDKRRNDIRRAERDGITVDESVGINDVLTLAEKTYQRQEKKIHFSDLATRIERVLLPESQCRCFVARNKDGTPLAGIFIVWDHKDAYYFLGGHNPESHRGAGALAIWQAIRYAAVNLGLQRFDFLGSHLEQFERFFRDFGGVWTPTYHVSWERPSLRRDLRRVFERLQKTVKKYIGARAPNRPMGEPASL
jgi:hypothetical protein